MGIWPAAMLLFFLFSCGYKLEGGGYINEDVTRVAVDVFENRSSQTRAGVVFANELIREILRKTDTRVVDSSAATRTIRGTVKTISFSTLSRSSTEKVVERRATAVVDVKLVGPDNKILWSASNFSSKEEYTVSDSNVDDEASIREAVDKIAQRTAERIVSRMRMNF